ncbi:TolC family protein [Legionella cardiaca]|uniref:TolC family protein n=1 Tax=Legionella cardiaca TaxID=1071983 RepID=A0ABY8ANA2_9GAMM|nr:TolC family protein [Legionella cardiaca]WED42140.1 TolC family protein [Legionella cardiaca]
MEVFQQALVNEPIYQNEVLKTLVSKANIGIDQSLLLPHVGFTSQVLGDKQSSSGAMVSSGLFPRNNKIKAFDNRLSLTQPVFNWANFKRLSASKLSYQIASANLNAKFQDLIVRVAEAYFNTLYYENNLNYYKSNKITMAKQLSQVKEKYRIGKANRNDLDMAMSAFSLAESNYITAQSELAEQKLHLAEISAIEYPYLARLKDNFPRENLKPGNLQNWVDAAVRQNWSIKTNQLRVKAARERIKQAFAGHLPNANVEVYYDVLPFHIQNGSLLVAAGSSRVNNLAAAVNINVPIYSGGLVAANTKKAQYLFRIAEQQLDASCRKTTYSVKQNYLRILSDIHKIKSDQQTIASNQNSLNRLKERYALGATDLMQVINQQDRLIHSQIELNKDRFNYIIEILKFKKNLGTLSIDDIKMVNSWLEK